MVAMAPTEFDGAVPVDGYGPGFFRVRGQVHHGPVIVTSEGAQPWGGMDDLAPLLALGGRIDVLFIGMGKDIARLPPDLQARFDAIGIMAEAMATPSAARSYNVTLSEGRRVACALLPI